MQAGPYTRLDNWIDPLARELASSRHCPFDWGSNDCLQFVGRCVSAQTGGDNPVQDLYGQYRTAQGALRALRRIYGVRLPIEVADKLWGPRVPIAMARLGDIVAADGGEPIGMGPSFGMCYGRNSLFVGTHGDECGLVRLNTLTLEHCYQPWASSSRQ